MKKNAKRQHIRWDQAKWELMNEFELWIKECEQTRRSRPDHMIEFLFQRGFIKGNEWHLFINSVAEKNKKDKNPIGTYLQCKEPLREGFIIPDTWV